METLTISKDCLRDAIYKEMRKPVAEKIKECLGDAIYKKFGNPVTEEQLIEKIKDILRSNGKVQCMLDGIIIPVYLNKEHDEIIIGDGIDNS